MIAARPFLVAFVEVSDRRGAVRAHVALVGNPPTDWVGGLEVRPGRIQDGSRRTKTYFPPPPTALDGPREDTIAFAKKTISKPLITLVGRKIIANMVGDAAMGFRLERSSSSRPHAAPPRTSHLGRRAAALCRLRLQQAALSAPAELRR